MNKVLTIIAVLLFFTGNLFAQITDASSTDFKIRGTTDNGTGVEKPYSEVQAEMNDSARAALDTLYLYVTADGDTLRIDSTFVAMLSAVIRGRLTAEDSVWIGTFEGSTFRDLNIKQTNVSKAIRIEERTGTESYEIGIGTDGTFALYDDDGSLSFYIADGTNLVVVEDSIWVKKTSRFSGAVKMEDGTTVVGNSDADTVNFPADMKYAEGLSLDLDYYFNRNVVQFMADLSRDAASVYTGWTNFNAGVHADDVTNYKTDAQSIQITIPNGGALDGAYLDITDYDFTHFAGGDTSVMADYINISVYILTQDITDLGSSDIGIFFCADSPTTRTNYFYYLMKNGLSNGWTHLQIAKSAFSGIGTCAGDSMWNSIDYILVINQNVVTDAEVVFSFDNIQMVRKAVAGAYPNPFQRETANGTWIDEWTSEGDHNSVIVKESGVLGYANFDGTSSEIKTAAYFEDFHMSGILKAGTGSAQAEMISLYSTTQYTAIYSDLLYVYDSTTTTHTAAFNIANYDLVYWQLDREGTSLTLSASLTGISGSWTSVSTFTWTGAKQLTFGAYDGQRHYSLGSSTVEFAQLANEAHALTGMGLKIVKDSLWVQRGDSTAHILVDFFYNP